ncbi:MAG: M48 family metalloprotease, partial [Desulfobacterales bacterium]
LPAFTTDWPLFQRLPTLEGLLFMGLFIGHLLLMWNVAYETHRRVLSSELGRREYVNSHLMFNLPVLLPWLLLSGIVDLINLLPFPALQRLIATPLGQMAYFLFFLFFVALTAPALVQRFWGCKPLEPGPLRSRIDGVCQRANLKYANILYWPIFGGRMITAGVMGLIRQFRYLLVTDALLKYLADEELEAVIAHEIGHVKRKHLLYYLFFFGGFMLISLLGLNLVIFALLHGGSFFQLVDYLGQGQTNITSLIYSLCLIVLFVIYFRFIFGFFMRNFERQADTYVYAIFPTARPLISTLQKIARSSGQDPQRPNWHHFSIAQRVEFLERCESDRRWIKHHDRKIRRSIFIFVLGMIGVAVLNFQVDYFNAGSGLKSEHLERILVREIEGKSDDPMLQRLLGDIRYDLGKWEGAMAAYEATLQLLPEDIHALNNLAWLYATCENEHLRRPRRALILARKAARRMAAPHILDTLAEAYFVNGQWEEAVAAARNTLLLAKDNREYYQSQLERFESYLTSRPSQLSVD